MKPHYRSAHVQKWRLSAIDAKIDKMVEVQYNIPIEKNGVDAMAFNQTKYITEFIKENYDRIEVKVPKGKKDLLKKLAKDHNLTDDKGRASVSRLIVEAVEEKYGVDLSKS